MPFMRRRIPGTLLLSLLVALPATAAAQSVRSAHGVVVTGSALASRVGADVLAAGGNAVDAAVAAAFALAVVEPSMSGIGGRTQILLRTAAGSVAAIDGTTEVPAAWRGGPEANEDAYGPRTIAVPGTVAALDAALRAHGTWPLARVLAPAMRLAEEGFALPAPEAERIASAAQRLREFEGSRRHFLKSDGSAYGAGATFRQPALARTLRSLAADGARSFYDGRIGAVLARELDAAGAFVTRADLAAYQAAESLIVRGRYRGHDIIGSYLPASGATAIEALQILEHFDLPALVGSAQWAALLHHALLASFSDRVVRREPARAKADWLTSSTHAARRAEEIRTRLAGARTDTRHDDGGREPENTTHLSVADRHGNVVALTQSVGPTFGSKVASLELGFIHAATMEYLGALEPGTRRHWSSQTPLIVLRGDAPAYVLGGAGARRILSAVVATLSRAIDAGLPLDRALAAPRIHATPTRIDLEQRAGAAWTDAQADSLRALGIAVRMREDAPYFARINAIAYDHRTREWVGVSDPRWEGAALAPDVAAAAAEARADTADVLLLGGRVLDGAGNPWVRRDIAIRGDRISFIGDAAIAGVAARDSVDVSGRLVTPGFWDVHSHAELETAEGRVAVPQLFQGITTVVLGLDGGGEPDIDAVFAGYERAGIAVNALRFVGHGHVRRTVMGAQNRAPTSAEMQRMKELVDGAMRHGAFGLSTGLFYVPGSYATTDEVVELNRVAARHGGIYDTHDRDLGASYQGIGYLASTAEAIEIGERAGTPVIFSHFSPQGAHNYGRAAEGARLIEEARARGVNVMAAQHPYTATQSTLSAYAVPRWASAGRDSMIAHFTDDATRRRLDIETLEMLELRGGAEKIMIVDPRPELNGRTLAQVAAAWRSTVPETVRRILREGEAAVMNLELYDIANIRYLAQKDWMMTCTDGRTPHAGQDIVHPRVYGAFTRKLRLFVYDEPVITLPFAVRGMTGLAATFFNVTDRGLLREGWYADIAVFAEESIRDRATYEDPHNYSQGTVHVLVNGEFAVRDGQDTGALTGRPIRRHPGGAR
ncbi:MAG TPA: gamma-glutamyltransferase [Longimicrobiales bacterium]|nr:gamma-glutamyltransferase [Longimicrobiales bacterium]